MGYHWSPCGGGSRILYAIVLIIGVVVAMQQKSVQDGLKTILYTVAIAMAGLVIITLIQLFIVIRREFFSPRIRYERIPEGDDEPGTVYTAEVVNELGEPIPMDADDTEAIAPAKLYTAEEIVEAMMASSSWKQQEQKEKARHKR